MSIYMICSVGLFICVAVLAYWLWSASGMATTMGEALSGVISQQQRHDATIAELRDRIDILEARDRQFHDDLNALAKNHATSIAELRDRMDALDNRADATALDYGRVMQVLAEKLKIEDEQ